MSVRKFLPENPLAKILGDRSGMLIAHALQHANANLAHARPRYLGALNSKLDQLRDLALEDEKTRNELYRLARDIGCDAGMLGFAHVSQAAFSLCDQLVSDVPAARMRAAIGVHIDAIMVLRAMDEGRAETEGEAILRGLFSLSGRTP